MSDLKPGITHRLSEIESTDARERLFSLFDRREGLKRIGVEAARTALKTAAEAKIAQSQAESAAAQVSLAEIDFMIAAGEEWDDLNSEPIWQVKKGRNPSGGMDVILECLMTEQDIQALQSKNASIIRQQVSSDDGDIEGMLGDGDGKK